MIKTQALQTNKSITTKGQDDGKDLITSWWQSHNQKILKFRKLIRKASNATKSHKKKGWWGLASTLVSSLKIPSMIIQEMRKWVNPLDNDIDSSRSWKSNVLSHQAPNSKSRSLISLVSSLSQAIKSNSIHLRFKNNEPTQQNNKNSTNDVCIEIQNNRIESNSSNFTEKKAELHQPSICSRIFQPSLKPKIFETTSKDGRLVHRVVAAVSINDQKVILMTNESKGEKQVKPDMIQTIAAMFKDNQPNAWFSHVFAPSEIVHQMEGVEVFLDERKVDSEIQLLFLVENLASKKVTLQYVLPKTSRLKNFIISTLSLEESPQPFRFKSSLHMFEILMQVTPLELMYLRVNKVDNTRWMENDTIKNHCCIVKLHQSNRTGSKLIDFRMEADRPSGAGDNSKICYLMRHDADFKVVVGETYRDGREGDSRHAKLHHRVLQEISLSHSPDIFTSICMSSCLKEAVLMSVNEGKRWLHRIALFEQAEKRQGQIKRSLLYESCHDVSDISLVSNSLQQSSTSEDSHLTGIVYFKSCNTVRRWSMNSTLEGFVIEDLKFCLGNCLEKGKTKNAVKRNAQITSIKSSGEKTPGKVGSPTTEELTAVFEQRLVNAYSPDFKSTHDERC